tara:strand:+ start:2766 stop:5972 length:3207 start_codon:yes stop_codon:yes gene_type:complete
MAEKVKKVSHLEHILLRPDSYVGPTALQTDSYWVLDGEHFSQKQVKYAPALLKIFDEILVNAIDRNSVHPKEVKYIKVNVDTETGAITVENNGPLGGISVELHQEEQLWNPELTFGHLLTSTNYDDNTNRVVGGRNGYGAKLANVYSRLFSVSIKDPINNKKYTQIWENNMTKCNKPKITNHTASTSSVSITFVPDWARFGMKKMDNDIFKIIEKRVWDAAFCTSSNCKVSFQGSEIKSPTPEQYMRMLVPDADNIVTVVNPRWTVCVAPSDAGFQQVSFVNGICTTRGGTHVDYIASMIASGIIDDLAKKIKLRPQQVKNTLFVFVRATLVNPTFSSQIKSECTLKAQEFGSKFEPPKSFIKNVLKTGVQDEVMALSKVREDKELKKTDGTKKSKITGIPKLDDANWAGTAKSSKTILIITEGDSAKTLAIAGLSVVGRDRYGVFPLRGKCKNVRDASTKQLMDNEEFNNLKKILGLQQGKVYSSVNELRYGNLMIMTDADNDGSHIKGLVLNMFHYFWPSLLDIGFVICMVTPIIKVTKAKQQKWFFTDSAFRCDESSKIGSGWKVKYYKGLGTSTSVEAREYFKSIEKLTVAFEVDDETDKSMVLAFDKTKADSRKAWLTKNSSGHDDIKYGSINSLTITNFIHRDLVDFSLADVKRSIAHMCDGMKPSQRKVLHACFRKNLTNEMKVAQLAAYVSETTAYHHGEVSLADTIVKMAHDYVGSNNMNYLEPCGQFGTRLMGGKDASQTRYIFTKLMPHTRKVFDPNDDAVLSYLTDDGKTIEPEYFVPVLPTVLVNGTEGIGTGFSSNVPSFNPDDIKANIKRILRKEGIQKMSPWVFGFKGTIVANGDAWVATGTFTQKANRITVTELPPGYWTQDFKEHLDVLSDKKTISGYKNNSTTEGVHFEIDGFTGKDPVKDFKLSKTIRVSNMHLFHPNYGIKKYHSAEDILVDFVEIRVDYYKKRKEHLKKQLEQKVLLLSSKAAFVQQVVDEEIIVFKCKKSQLEAQIAAKGFMKIDGTYDYLLNIKTYQYTEEAIETLMKDSVTAKKELKTLDATSIFKMWENNLS